MDNEQKIDEMLAHRDIYRIKEEVKYISCKYCGVPMHGEYHVMFGSLGAAYLPGNKCSIENMLKRLIDHLIHGHETFGPLA